MQLSLITLFIALTATTIARPLSQMMARDDCDISKCAIALGPSAAGCAFAASEAFLNVLLDAGCVAGVANSVVNAPAVCSPCFNATGISTFVNETESAVSQGVQDVKDGVNGVTDTIKDIF